MERQQNADDKFAAAQRAAIARALKEHEKLMRQAQRETQGGGYQTGGDDD